MNKFKIYKDSEEYYIIDLNEDLYCNNKNCENELIDRCIFTVGLDRNKKNEINLYCLSCMKHINMKNEIQFKNIALIKNSIPKSSKPVIFNKIGLVNANNNISVFEAAQLKTERTLDKTKYKYSDSIENATIGINPNKIIQEDNKKELELKSSGVLDYLKSFQKGEMITDGTRKQIK